LEDIDFSLEEEEEEEEEERKEEGGEEEGKIREGEGSP
jgi:hypothetical protein